MGKLALAASGYDPQSACYLSEFCRSEVHVFSTMSGSYLYPDSGLIPGHNWITRGDHVDYFNEKPFVGCGTGRIENTVFGLEELRYGHPCHRWKRLSI